MQEHQQLVGFGRFCKLLIIFKKYLRSCWGATELYTYISRILAPKGNTLANFNIQYKKFTLNTFGDSDPIGFLLSVKTWLFSWSLGHSHAWAHSVVHVHIFTTSLNYVLGLRFFFCIVLILFLFVFYTALSHKLWVVHLYKSFKLKI